MNQKIIFIDWYGTLSDSKFWDHLDASSFERIGSTLFGDFKHTIIPWMRGKFSTEEIISQISENTKLDYDYLLREFIVSCKNMVIQDSTLQLIKDLRHKGAKVYIATDNMDSFSRWTVPALGLDEHFNGILNSSVIKALKGDFDSDGNSLFFQNFLVGNNLNPGECILIDDSEDKVDRIKNFGINYHKIDKSSELKNILLKLL